MATTTTNLALIKPAGTDKIRISQINSNMDILDDKIGPVGNTSLQEQLNNKQGALTFDSAPTSGSTNPVTSGGIYNAEQSVRNTVAIVATGNTAPKAITVGEFVQWKGAVYTATANIPSGGTLSTSNLQAVPNGGLNALKSRVDTLNSNFVNSYGELATGITYQKYGKIVIIYFNGNTVSNSSGWTDLLTLPANLGQSRYTVHAQTMSGHDVRIGGGNVVAYRGNAGDMFGTIVYIMS